MGTLGRADCVDMCRCLEVCGMCVCGLCVCSVCVCVGAPTRE